MKRTTLPTRSAAALGAALLMMVAVLPAAARAQDAGIDYTNTVTVAAGATVEMEADLATLTLSVRSANVDAAEATRGVATKTEAVVDALIGAGVTDEEMTVGSVRLGRKTDRRGRFLRYVASVVVRVKTDRLDRLSRFIDAGVSGGASGLRLTYEVKDRSGAVDQALREAMAFARAKATALAESENRQVGQAIVISEYDSRPPRSVSYDADLRGTRDAVGGAVAAAELIPLEPPTLETSARITVTFALI